MTNPFELNLRHVRALCEAARLQSLNRASTAAGLSQPALTQGLTKLEKQLGAALFERHSGGVATTAAGAAFVARAERALGHLGVASRRIARNASRGFAAPDRLMTGTQLDAFLHFADAQGYAGAAAASGISQPALHRAVRELEQICGTPLAERRGRGMMLTTAGSAMARGIRLARSELAAGIAETRPDTGEPGRIVIGAMPLSRALVLPRALSHMLADNPSTVLDIVEGSWRELVEPLLDGVIDLMIGALRDTVPPGVEQIPLFTDRPAIFARRGHPLAQRKASVADLRTQAWVIGPKGTPLRFHWERLFGETLPPVPVECGSVMVIRGLLMQSDLLTLLSPDQIAMEIETGMLVRIGSDLGRPSRMIGISVRSGWRPTRAQEQLIHHLKQASAETRLPESQ
ncbi:DNA-binding transcriptional LysR family regulator [Sphingopyxis sp. OAS728]|uniref:LysR family transcriptional regulator n=1 Tax=Sphingopyxis sp. OAS728 TaxID=2663823 RepID=UPI0017895959|nr:LysR family transcriptional regulator [Sphingopyxis sp. OAS728]MBE1527982.1 DNA-binding transcriptional LysR family regulator [Sphingopyxis sp. OAS728]